MIVLGLSSDAEDDVRWEQVYVMAHVERLMILSSTA